MGQLTPEPSRQAASGSRFGNYSGESYPNLFNGPNRAGQVSSEAVETLPQGVRVCAFSIGPGVVVWLALSELMPTRIRFMGMGIALLVN